MLLASVLHAASSAVQPQKKGSASTFAHSQTVVRAVPVKLLLPHIGARTYSISAACTLQNATSHHRTRRALRVVAVDEAEDLGAARERRLRRIDATALPRHRERAARI